jgi:hypothetical protein
MLKETVHLCLNCGIKLWAFSNYKEWGIFEQIFSVYIHQISKAQLRHVQNTWKETVHLHPLCRMKLRTFNEYPNWGQSSNRFLQCVIIEYEEWHWAALPNMKWNSANANAKLLESLIKIKTKIKIFLGGPTPIQMAGDIQLSPLNLKVPKREIFYIVFFP